MGEKAGDPYRVLVVDDDADVADVVLAILSDDGYEVGSRRAPVYLRARGGA